MSFAVSADAYGRFMGRFSEPLADQLLDLLGLLQGALRPAPPAQVLDVGCGPGALTGRLVGVLGERAVCAVDPMPAFVAAVQERWPGVRADVASAEALPFVDDRFDITLAQLVVHFMADPVAGLREMRRVTRPGGTVAASVWDHGGGAGPLSTFWSVATELDPSVTDESALAGSRAGELEVLFSEAGFSEVSPARLTVSVPFASFEEWWEPYTLGVGPAGDHVAGLDDEARRRLRDACAARLPAPPFGLTASAWTVVARA